MSPRCVRVSGGAAVLSKSKHTSRGGNCAGYPGHCDGMEEQQGGLVPLWQVTDSHLHTVFSCLSPETLSNLRYSLLLYASTSVTSLYFSDLSKATSEQLNLTVEMMRFLSWLVTHHPTVLGGNQWDFLLCSMLAWLEVRQGDRTHGVVL